MKHMRVFLHSKGGNRGVTPCIMRGWHSVPTVFPLLLSLVKALARLDSKLTQRLNAIKGVVKVTALFGFGLRDNFAYLYLTIANERIEGKVTEELGVITSVLWFDGDGFIAFSCLLGDEEYIDFSDVAEHKGVLDKWTPLFSAVKEVRIVNE